ncbi:MAG TPA: hypothetical protein PLE12_11930 [Propionicimonas sp.]|nr:hypothetical protein [Propionicimonas sp.]
MTSEPPTRFENYPGENPPVADPSAPDDFPLAAPPLPVADPWTRPYRAPQRLDAGSSGGGRSKRATAGLAAVPVVIAALLGGAFVANSRATHYETGFDVPGVVVPEDPGYQAPEPDDSEVTTLYVGDYSADLPDGWEVVEDSGERLVIAKGTNRVEARLVPAEVGEVTEALAAIVEEHRGRFVGEWGEPVDTSAADVARATLTATGTVGTRDARFRADLWQGPDSDTALLVVQVLTASKNSAAGTAAREFAAALGAQVA